MIIKNYAANPNVLAIWLQGILYTLPSLKTERRFNPVADEDILPFQKEIVQNLLIQPIFLNSMMKIPREIYFLNKFLNLNTYMDIIIPQDGTLDLHSRFPKEFHKPASRGFSLPQKRCLQQALLQKN